MLAKPGIFLTIRAMHTYLLSDLHLTPERPQTIEAFIRFLATQAPSAERVYILGDLFEYWIGDDAAEMLGASPILNAMAQLANVVNCYFMAGNRDFLVREKFSELTGFKILEDETVVDLYGTPTLLLHGDSLCTDDHAHQEFRTQMMTNAAFCDMFLQLSIPERIEKAKQARMQSGEHKSQISMGIMDVTEEGVLAAFERHQVQQMIHGHTHRHHQHQTSSGAAARHVLGDWHNTSSIMLANEDGLEITNQAI